MAEPKQVSLCPSGLTKTLDLHPTFSRHGRAEASFTLPIWLNENVATHPIVQPPASPHGSARQSVPTTSRPPRPSPATVCRPSASPVLSTRAPIGKPQCRTAGNPSKDGSGRMYDTPVLFVHRSLAMSRRCATAMCSGNLMPRQHPAGRNLRLYVCIAAGPLEAKGKPNLGPQLPTTSWHHFLSRSP